MSGLKKVNTDSTNMKKIIREYCKQLNALKFYSLHEMKKFLKTHKQPNSPKIKEMPE